MWIVSPVAEDESSIVVLSWVAAMEESIVSGESAAVSSIFDGVY